MIVFDEYLHSEEEYSDQHSHTKIIQETPINREIIQVLPYLGSNSGGFIFTPKCETGQFIFFVYLLAEKFTMIH